MGQPRTAEADKFQSTAVCVADPHPAQPCGDGFQVRQLRFGRIAVQRCGQPNRGRAVPNGVRQGLPREPVPGQPERPRLQVRRRVVAVASEEQADGVVVEWEAELRQAADDRRGSVLRHRRTRRGRLDWGTHRLTPSFTVTSVYPSVGYSEKALNEFGEPVVAFARPFLHAGLDHAVPILD